MLVSVGNTSVVIMTSVFRNIECNWYVRDCAVMRIAKYEAIELEGTGSVQVNSLGKSGRCAAEYGINKQVSKSYRYKTDCLLE